MSRRRRARRDKRAMPVPVDPSPELLRAFEVIEQLKLAPVFQPNQRGASDGQPAQQ